MNVAALHDDVMKRRNIVLNCKPRSHSRKRQKKLTESVVEASGKSDWKKGLNVLSNACAHNVGASVLAQSAKV